MRAIGVHSREHSTADRHIGTTQSSVGQSRQPVDSISNGGSVDSLTRNLDCTLALRQLLLAGVCAALRSLRVAAVHPPAGRPVQCIAAERERAGAKWE